MILKEAYRYQKCLSTMIGQAEALLLNNSFVTSTTQRHNRKKANSDADDETIEVDKPITNFNAIDVINFIADAIKEKQKISDAIVAAKRNTEIDIDSSISLNKIKQEYIGYLRRLDAMDSSERKTYGTDYKFDVDGKQTSYRYEVIETTTIDFDRNDVRGLAKKLQKECDEISSKLDLIELTTDVEFTPKWDVNDTLEEIIASNKK